MFVPHDQRGGGEGGERGDNRRIKITIISITPVPYRGEGEHKVLLVKRCPYKTLDPSDIAKKLKNQTIPISKITKVSEANVETQLNKLISENQGKVAIRDGEGKYIDRLVILLNTFFSFHKPNISLDLLFSSEKIG